jgi:hypothetical protein
MHQPKRFVWISLASLIQWPHKSVGAPLRRDSTVVPEKPSTKSVLQSQWQNPSDILSILLIIGGEVIHKALAQLSGGLVVPVAVSFGWVNYSISALLAATRDGHLMPSQPDYPSILVNSITGHARTKDSWILGRVLRDIESRVGHVDTGLNVSVFKAKRPAGVPFYDWLWYSGFAVILIQLIIATIPFITEGNWSILFVTVTAMGILLALVAGVLPQWKAEKWTCRRKAKMIYSLTRGNGYKQVVVIISDGVGLNLEDLSISRVRPSLYTRVILGILACLWIALLLTVAGLKEGAWYLFFIGCIGMGQNIIVASAARDPGAFGIHLEHIKDIRGRKVMQALKDTETALPQVGASLLKIFFPRRAARG